MTRMPSLTIPLAVGAVFGLASTSFAVGDSDLYWHLATARETLARGLVRTDLFSWTIPGAPVGVDQWLGQLAWYAAYATGEWRGVLALRAIAVTALVALIVAAALARRPDRPILAVAISLPAILLVRFVSTERPELFGFVLFAALILLLQLDGDAPLVALAPLLLVWANVHGSFALGAALTVAVAALALRTGRARRRPALVAVLAALAALVLTPAGLGTLGAPGLHLLEPPRQIQEWSVPDPLTLAGALWAIVLGAVFITAILAPPARARDLIVLVPVAFLSLMAARQMPFLAIAATPYLADRVPVAWEMVRTRLGIGVRFPTLPVRPPPPRWVDAATGAIALALVLAASSVGPARPDQSGYPTEILADLPPGPGLFHQYDWGGWLIWSAPGTPVFIDGRLVPYRAEVLADYHLILEARPGWREAAARWGIRYILVRPHDPVAVRALDLGWRARSSSPRHILIEVGR